MKSLIFFCAILTIGVGSAHADVGVGSDADGGSFCSSSKFLAYEFSFSKGAAGYLHRLYVVHFAAPLSAQPRTLQIPNFVVHRMTCNESQVEILGWDKRYVFSVSGTELVLASEAPLSPPGKFPKGYPELHNLADLSPGDVGSQGYAFKLGADDPVYKYELRIQKSSTKNPCKIAITTNLVKIDGKGEVREILPIYNNKEASTECGE